MFKLRNITVNLLAAAVAVLAFGFIVSTNNKVSAANCTWTGGDDQFWSNSLNWSGCTVPANGDFLIFPLGAANTTMVNDLPSFTEFVEVSIQWDSYVFTGNPISFSGLGPFAFDDDDDSGTVNFQLDIDLTSNAEFQVMDPNTTLDLTGAITGIDNVIKTFPGVLELSGSNSFSSQVSVNDGVLRVTNSNSLVNNSLLIINVGGTFEVNNNITINVPMQADGSGYNNTGAFRNAGGDNILQGNLSFPGTDTAFFSNAGSLVFTGQLSGNSNLYFNGVALTILSSSIGNTNTGQVFINDGTLRLDPSGGVDVAGNIIVGDNTGVQNSAILSLTDNDEITALANITINSDGLMDLNSFSNTVSGVDIADGNLNASGGTMVISNHLTNFGGIINGPGTFTLDGSNLTCNSTTGNGDAEIIVNLNMFTSPKTLNASGGFNDPDCIISGVIAGDQDLNIASGRYRFAGNNTFTGNVTIASGTFLRITHNNALGTNAGDTTVNGTGVLDLSNNLNVTTETVNITGTGTDFSGALNASADTNIWAGPVVISGTDTMIASRGDGVLSVSGVISGTVSNSLQFQKFFPGTGDVRLGALNTFTVTSGAVLLQDVHLVKIASVNIFPDTQQVDININSNLDLNSFSETIGNLTGDGTVTLGTGTLAIGASNTAGTYGGVITGNGGVAKVGTGVSTLSGNNTYSGTTNVAAGTLLVNGNQPSSVVSLAAGATIGGSGTVGAITGAGGTVAPGNSPGILNVAGNFILGSSDTLNIEINGTTVGTQYDRVNVTGNVSLTNPTLNITLGFTPTNGQTFTIIQATGARVGTFNGLPNNTTFTVSGQQFTIQYGSSSVVLTAGATGGGTGGGGLGDTGISIPVAILIVSLIGSVGVLGTVVYIRRKRKSLVALGFR